MRELFGYWKLIQAFVVMLRAALRRFGKRMLAWLRSIPIVVSGEYRAILSDMEAARRLAMLEGHLDDELWSAMLRLYAHALDKSLHCETRDWERGRYAYMKAREALARIRSNEMRVDPSVLWAKSRIDDYAGGTDKARKNGETPTCGSYVPFDLLIAMLRTRRSTRTFRTYLVDEEMIRKLIEAGSWAPSSCNRQSVRVFVTNDPEIAFKCHALCPGRSCFGAFIPCFASFCVDVRPYQHPREYGLTLIDAALAAQNVCLAAHSLGLSVTLMAWSSGARDNERDLRDLLGIPAHFRIALNAVVGYAESIPETPVRKRLGDFYRLISHTTKEPVPFRSL